MAGKRSDQKSANGNGGGRVKFRYADAERYVDLDVNNVDQSVADQLKALVGALSGRTVIAPTRTLAAPKVATTSVVDETDSQEEAVVDSPEEEISGPDDGDEVSTNGSTRKRRLPPDPKVINDLDITAGPMPLKTFVEQKGPRKAQDRLVVVATWLKKHKGYEEITRDHFYTCYQQMGGSGQWKALNDFDTYIRTMASRKSWFEPGTGAASFKVTIIATNYVDGMTPTAA